MRRSNLLGATSLGLLLAWFGFGQSTTAGGEGNTQPQEQYAGKKEKKHEPGAAREIGGGAGTAGVGAAKGAGDLAKGTGKGAVDLVTLHPVNAGESLGKGAVGAGKDVSVGTVKGTGKVGKGIGRAFKHLF